MDDKMFEKLGAELQGQVKQAVEAAQADQKAEVTKLIGSLKDELGANSPEFKALKTQLDEIQVEMKKSVDYEAKADRPVGVQLKEVVGSKDFQSARKERRPFSFLVKASDITNANSVTNTIPAPYIVPGISESPYRQPFLRDIETVFNTNSPTIYWYEETSRTDGSAAKAEAAAYGQGDQAWTQYSQSVRKLVEYQKFSDEMMDDNDWLVSRMQNKLITDLFLLLDAQQYSGNGTAPNLKGITGCDTAYSAPTGLANNVDSPTFFDILLAAHTQVTNAYFTPNYFIMHPTNVAQLMSRKTSDAYYQMPPWVSVVGGRLTILGLPVIANTGVTVNTFTVGDFSKVNLAIRKDIEIRLWDQNSTDPIYGMNTITATMRAAQFVSGQDAAALVTGDLNQTNIDGLTKA